MKLEDMKAEPVYWQRLLRLAGYYKGRIDGIRGPLQKAAEGAWDAAAEYLAAKYGLFDERSEGHIATLMPPAQEVARRWLAKARVEAEAEGTMVKIICGTRSYAEQDALYRKRPRVTRARGGYSWHNFGLAFDFGVFSGNGKEYFGDSPMYAALGKLARGVDGAEWGGDWSGFKDEPHIQLRRFNTISEARNQFERK